MRTFFRSVAGLLAAAAWLFTGIAHAANWVADHDPAQLPSQIDPPWLLDSPDGLNPALVEGQGLILETGADQRLFYIRRGIDVNFTDSFRIAASLRLPAGANPAPDAVPASLGFIRGDGTRAALHIAPGRVFLTAGADGNGAGPSLAVDTTVQRTYRLSIERGTTPPTVVAHVSGPGGGTLRMALFAGPAADGPRLFFGSTHGTAGRAVWRAVSDNAAGLAFTYQGRLNFPRTTPANGKFDFEFELWDSPEGGTQLGTKRQLNSVEARGGMFSVDLNFGPLVLTDADPWLAISVRKVNTTSPGVFTRLNPRVPVRPVPLALQLTEPPEAVAVTEVNGIRGPVYFEVGQGLNLETDLESGLLNLTLQSPGTVAHNHFGEAWQGANSVAGLLLGNTDPAGAALRLDATGDLLRGFPGGGQPGQLPTFRVTRFGDVFGRAFTGNGSALTGLSWEQLPGTIPVEQLPMIPRDKLPPDLGGGSVGSHDHYGASWSGSSPLPGLQVENTHGEGVGLYGRAPAVAGTGVRGYGQRTGVEGGGALAGVMASSSAGSALMAFTDTGINLELNSDGGDFIQGTKRFTGLTYRVTAGGDVFARSFSGNGAGITNIQAANIVGLPTGGGGGSDHNHFGQTWSGTSTGDVLNGLKVVNNREAVGANGLVGQAVWGAGVVGEGSSAGVMGSNINPGVNSYGSFGAQFTGASGYNEHGTGVRGDSAFGAGVEGFSLHGPAVVGTSQVDGGDLFVGRNGINPADVKFTVSNDGGVTATRFAGDGSFLTGLQWDALDGQVPEFKVPATISRTGHNHAGETWSASGTVLTLQGGQATGVPAVSFEALAGNGLQAISASGTAITAFSTSGESALEAVSNGGGTGIRSSTDDGVGVASTARGSGSAFAARTQSGTSLMLRTATGPLVRAFHDAPGAEVLVFAVANNGDVSSAGSMSATAFNSTSDRNAKAGFTAIDPQEVLRKVTALPITRWAFTNETSVEHIGPVAQDFHAAFGVGPDERHISTVDADGVALAAIQGLNAKLESELRAKDDELRELKSEFAEMKKLLQRALENGR